MAASLRASPLDAFFTVELPLARRGFLTAAILVFAHTVGEFGVVLMIGGAIPKQTEVLSIKIYEFVEASQYASAHFIAAGMLAFAFTVVLAMLLVGRGLGRLAP
jgi:molybdate transport system permease protein